MKLYKDEEIWKFRPYIVGEKALVSMPVQSRGLLREINEVPIECARFTRDQWIGMDQTVVTVSRPLLATLNRLRRDGFCFSPPTNYDENGVLLVHEDCRNTSCVDDAVRVVANKVDQVAHFVFEKGNIEQLYVYLDMTLIQKTPVYDDESTWKDDTRLSVMFGFFTPDSDMYANLVDRIRY